ncbi:MAG: glycosyltransferase family 4 protein [Candidatus Rokubacteria bacterium]|nr:glycosyltransferase family 4 protein [Candidatus Rokubacteria bacterium]
MRALHLMSCRGWSSDAYWASRMAVELERAGHEVTLVCTAGTEARVLRRVRAAGVTRIQTLAFESGLRPIRDAADVRALRRALDQTDVLHVHRGKEHWLGAIANRLATRRRPLVRTRHIVQAIRAHALNRWLYREATDAVVTVTEAIRAQCVGAGLVPPAGVHAVPGGVDVERFHPDLDGAPFRRQLGIGPDVPLVGMVAGLRVMKGHEVLIEALGRLRQSGHRLRAVLVGRGPLEAAIRTGVAAAGLEEAVVFAGAVDDVPAAMAALDVALYVPRESEGMSRVVFEYLAAGRPLVASRVGVVPEVLTDGRDALLVPAEEPEALTAAIARLLEDSALRDRIGRAGAALARERFSGALVARRVAAIYQELIGSPPHGSVGAEDDGT